MGKWRALRDRAELHARVGTGKSPIREPEPAQDSCENTWHRTAKAGALPATTAATVATVATIEPPPGASPGEVASHESPPAGDVHEQGVLEPAREGSSKSSYEDGRYRTLRTRA